MQALVYTAPDQVTLRDEPEPTPAAGEVLLRIEAAGICGSDMHAYHGHDPRRVPPLILGHEACGRVVSDGAERRAVINPLVACGSCDRCQEGRANLCPNRWMIGMHNPGAFAEFVAVPERNLIAVPDDMNPVHAALVEPAGTALHALLLSERALFRPISEARVLVLGGGSIGLLSALWLHHHGCRRIELGDINALRRGSAERTAVCTVFDPAAAGQTPADCYDVVIDAVGNETTRRHAIAAVKPGGVVTHVGLGSASGGMDARRLTLSEITFIGSYTYTPLDLRAATEALYGGALGSLDWVAAWPLAEGAQAFDELDKGRLAAAKVVLQPA